MNETDLDKICQICEQGYDKALAFAEEECTDEDEESFEIMFKARLKITLIQVKEVMIERMLQERK